jgi:hypothetical protein
MRRLNEIDRGSTTELIGHTSSAPYPAIFAKANAGRTYWKALELLGFGATWFDRLNDQRFASATFPRDCLDYLDQVPASEPTRNLPGMEFRHVPIGRSPHG